MKKFILTIIIFVSVISVFGNDMLDIHFNKKYLEEELELLEKENKEFKNALAIRESNMRYDIINSIGAIGAWQFMPYTLKDLGYDSITVQKFRNNPDIFPKELQEHVLDLKIQQDLNLLKNQWWRNSTNINYLEKYVGKEIYGVKISLAGIIAASHIAGAGGVIKFFDSNGAYNPRDVYGTSLFTYMASFSKYDYNYSKINQIKTKIVCLKDSLEQYNDLTPLLNTSKLSIMDLHSRDTETVLTLNYQVISIFLSQNQQSYMYHLDLEQDFPNITEEYYFLEVLLQKNTILICLQDTEKSNGIIQMNGKGLSKRTLTLNLFSKKEIEYFNSTSNQYGMHLGMSNSHIYLQNTKSNMLVIYPYLEVA